MSAAAGTFAMFEERIDPGRVSSFLLAAAMHLALFAVLVFGVRWQNRPPEAVVVELWNEPVPAQIQAEPKPEPAPAVLKPEAVIPKPDIAEKAPPPKPKPVPKVEQKPKPAPVAIRPRDAEAQRQIREQLNREQASLAIDRERQQIKDQLANDAAAARNKAIADWVNKVRAKIRGNIVLPPELRGNPEAIFDVVQLPTGEVLSVKLRKSSGHAGYDQAVERAVLKSSPLPRPDRPELFQRALELKFRPLD
ncbi:MAG: cell envelope integrity protein TolA [Pseudomonadota bacterium]